MLRPTSPSSLVILGFLAAMATSACAAPPETVCSEPATAICSAVADEARPAKERARDANRHPEAVLEFAGIERGQRILDLAAGGGYYSAILANAVGSGGSVTLHNSPWTVGKFGDMGIPDRLKQPNMANVTYLEEPLDALKLAPNSLDVALIVLFYHDTYWQKIDRAAMNQSLLDALAPGGTFLVIDHHAEAGSGARDVETLHRVDVDEVKRDIAAAGFVLDGESDVLRHPEDDRTLGVFDPRIRGETDRFVLRFRKP